MKQLVPKPLSLYYAFVFLRNFAFFGAVLVPFFTEWGGITLMQTQLIQSWFMFWIFVLEVPTGAVADYLGKKYSMTLGALVVAFATIVYGSVPDFTIFLIGEFLFAVGFALISGADQALLYDTLKQQGQEDQKTRVFGKAHAFSLVGMLLATPIGGYMAEHIGINAPMYLSAVPLVGAAIVGMLIPEPTVHSNQPPESRRYLDIVVKGFVYFSTHPRLRLIALDSIIVSTAAYFVIWFYQPLLQSVGVPIAWFGWFHVFLIAGEILISRNFAYLEKLVGSQYRFLRVSAVITSIGFFIVCAFPHFATIVLFLLLAGGIGLTRLEYTNSVLNSFIPSSERSTVLSSISMFRRLALVVVNPFMGYMADWSLGIALGIAGAIPLLVFVVPISFLRNKNKT